MKPPSTTNRMLFLFVAACAGLMLILIPWFVVGQLETVSKLGDTWVYVYLGVVGAGGALLAGASGWVVFKLWSSSRKKRLRREKTSRNPSQLSKEEKTQEIEENLTAVHTLREDAAVDADVKRELKPLIDSLEDKRDQQSLEIVAFGTISSGKSSLLNALAGRDVFSTDLKGGTTVTRSATPWPGMENVSLVDTPGLAEVDGARHVNIAATAARDADLVLVVVDGPLREYEHNLLAQLGEMEKRVLVCLNKTDWYNNADRDKLMGQLREQLREFVASGDVVAVSAQGAKRTRVRVLANGEEVEETVESPPDIAPLADSMLKVIRRDGKELLMANLLLRSRGLVEEARSRVKDSLDRKAWQLVDKYMWAAGGVAAVNPLPMVDVAAGLAISTKMVIDLAKVYKQDVDLDTASNLIGELGKNLIAILGATAVTPMVTTGVASLLKTVPGAGTVAGGLLQGTVQAIVTRWIGAVFIQYFRDEMQTPSGGLAALARRKWAEVTSVNELRKLVQAARQRISGAVDDDD